jgi:hypothetical protein
LTLVQEKVAEFSATMHVSSGSASGGSSAAPRKVKKVVSNVDEDVEVEESESVDSRQLQRGYSKVSVQNILEVERSITKIKENMPSMNEALKCMTEMMELGRQDRHSIAEDKMRLNDIENKGKKDQIELDRQAANLALEDTQRKIEKDRQAADLAAENMQRHNKLEERRIDVENKGKKVQNEQEEEATVIKERRIDVENKGKNDQIKQRKRMLELDREEFEFSEMKKKRASPEEPENKQKAGSISISSVAEEHPDFFTGMDKKEYEDILMKAGGICARAYKKAGKKELPKVRRGRYDVAQYNPEDKETFVLPALKEALSNKNKPITEFFEKRND